MAMNMLKRVQAIHDLIKKGGFPSKEKLVERFGKCSKTIERDLDYLRRDLGAPLYFDREKRGYGYSEPGYFLPSMMVKEGEALALLLTHHLAQTWQGTSMAELTERAFRTLAEHFPQEVSLDAGKLGENLLVIDRTIAADPQVWKLILTSAKDRRRVKIAYRSPGHQKTVQRIIRPYMLMHHRNAWYVLAQDEYHAQRRVFALSRIKGAVQHSGTFEWPQGFDPREEIDANFGIWLGSESFPVCLRMSRGTYDIVKEHLARKDLKAIKLRGDGGEERVELRFTTNQEEELKHWVLQWGEHIEVLEPASLRERLAVVARKYRDWYGE